MQRSPKARRSLPPLSRMSLKQKDHLLHNVAGQQCCFTHQAWRMRSKAQPRERSARDVEWVSLLVSNHWVLVTRACLPARGRATHMRTVSRTKSCSASVARGSYGRTDGRILSCRETSRLGRLGLVSCTLSSTTRTAAARLARTWSSLPLGSIGTTSSGSTHFRLSGERQLSLSRSGSMRMSRCITSLGRTRARRASRQAKTTSPCPWKAHGQPISRMDRLRSRHLGVRTSLAIARVLAVRRTSTVALAATLKSYRLALDHLIHMLTAWRKNLYLF